MSAVDLKIHVETIREFGKLTESEEDEGLRYALGVMCDSSGTTCYGCEPVVPSDPIICECSDLRTAR